MQGDFASNLIGWILQRNIEPRSCNHDWRGKAISIIYSECVYVALIIQQAMRIRIVLSCVACLAVPYLSKYLEKGTIYSETLLRKKWIFIFSKIFVWHISHP